MPTPRVFLTGFMGSGKSSIAPRAARLLDWTCVDLDAEIEIAESMSIPAIFDVLGEEAFRRAEREALLATASREHVVVSLGGGTVMPAENLSWCQAHGILVALDTPVDVLCERLSRREGTRPLLLGPDGSILRDRALRQRVESLLEQRRPVYSQAHVTIKTGSREPNDVAQDLARSVADILGLAKP